MLETKECASGNVYLMEVGYVAVNSINGLVFQIMDEEVIVEMQSKGGGSDSSSSLKKMSPDNMRKFFASQNSTGPHELASLLRSCNGNPVGNDFDERYKWIEENLHAHDGTELEQFIKELQDPAEAAKSRKGESAPSSKRPTGKAESITAAPQTS